MQRRTTLAALALTVAATTLLTTGCAFTPARQKTQVVLQVSDPDPAKWNLALNNARNAQTDLGKDNVDVEIVAYGPGIGMLKFDAPTANRVSDAIKSGVKIVACENTMTAQKLDKKEMNPNISYVPAGVVHIMQRQHQGWAYVRP